MNDMPEVDGEKLLPFVNKIGTLLSEGDLNIKEAFYVLANCLLAMWEGVGMPPERVNELAEAMKNRYQIIYARKYGSN
jgi:hypothetical protein